MSDPSQPLPLGPYRASDIRPGDPYELSDGYLIQCLPTGRRGAHSTTAGSTVLDTDPEAEPAGVDAGFTPTPTILRAPDISIGNIDDKPGFATKAPALAVEYADTGQDEAELRTKISQLLQYGTRYIWVVRLNGPRRVEIYEPGKPMRIALPGEELTAPGVLKNEVPVEALYDREVAHRCTLRNLLQRRGYENLDAVKDEGRLIEARSALRKVLARRNLELTQLQQAQIDACDDLATLEQWLEEAVVASTAADALR